MTHCNFDAQGAAMWHEDAEEIKATILVVDDERPIADLIQKILTKAGHRAEVVYSGSDAVRKAGKLKPHVIIMDISMPDMDGYEATGQIRELPELREVPIIFLTGRSAREDGGRAFARGASAYVRKPFTHDQIRDLVGLALQSVFRDG